MLAGLQNDLLCIREAHLTDREQVRSLINRVAAESRYLRTGCYQSTPSWERLLQLGAEPGEGLLLLLLWIGGQLVGYVRLYPDDRYGRTTGNIGIALLCNYRSRGLGTLLLRHMLDRAPLMGYSHLTADILADNMRSRRLFARYGFEQIGTRMIGVPFAPGEVEEITVRATAAGEENWGGL